MRYLDVKGLFYLCLVQNRVRGPRRRKRVLTRKYRLYSFAFEGHADRGRLFAYGDGEIVPARHSLVRIMIYAPGLFARLYRLADSSYRRREVRAPCGRPGLVVDDAQDFPIGCEPKYRLDEVMSLDPVELRGAHYDMSVRCRSNRLLSGKL